jgi:hypothetical protein
MISLKQEDRRPPKEEPNALNKLRTASMLMGGAGAGSYLLGNYFLPKESEDLLQRFKRIDAIKKTPSLLGYTDIASQLLHSKLLGGNVEGIDIIKGMRSPALLNKIAPFYFSPAIIGEWNKALPQNAGVLSKIQALPNLLDRFINHDYKTALNGTTWREFGPLDSSSAHYGAFYQGPLHALGQLYSEKPIGYNAAAQFVDKPLAANAVIGGSLGTFLMGPSAPKYSGPTDDYNASIAHQFPRALDAFIEEKTGRKDYFKGSLLNTYGTKVLPAMLPRDEQQKLLYELPSWLASHEKEFPHANEAFKTLDSRGAGQGDYAKYFVNPILGIKSFLQKYGLITAGAGVGAYGLYRFLKAKADKKKKEKELLEQSN